MHLVSISENKEIEKRVALTPEIAKKYIDLGFKLSLPNNYGNHLGFDDEHYKNLGVNFLENEKDIINFAPVLIESVTSTKVNYYYLINDGGDVKFVEGNLSIDKFRQDLIEIIDDLNLQIAIPGEAAAARIGQVRKDRNPKHTGNEEYNYFLAVLFSDQELEIYDYNRVVKCLNGFSEDDFLSQLEKRCSLINKSPDPLKPQQKGEFSVYLNKMWYSFSFLNEKNDHDPITNLDVSLLTHHIL